MDDLFMHFGSAVRGYRSGLVDKAFSERIMLAVTQVNGCRLCSYAHTKMALKAGMDSDEIRTLLGGDYQGIPEDQLVAILFAQHFAEAMGNPDAAAVRRLVETYGRDRAAAVLGVIRIIMVGNVYGNTMVSLHQRMKGSPVKESTLLRELTIIIGIVPLIPYLLAKKLVYQLFFAKDSRGDRVLDC